MSDLRLSTASIEDGIPATSASAADHDLWVKPLPSLPFETEAVPKGWRQIFNGWRMGVSLCVLAATIVLIINLVATLWASIKYGVTEGFGTIQQGSCEKTKTLSQWLHLTINGLSTMLLGASNYCMQCLSSPTREEVDSAHAQGIALDIGVPSVRNLGRIARRRQVLWVLLAVSGIPLHLLYNSAVFSTLATHSYEGFLASDDIKQGHAQQWSRPWSGVRHEVLLNISTYTELNNRECIRTYAKTYVPSHRNVVVVTTNQDIQGIQQAFWSGQLDQPEHGASYTSLVKYPAYEWICSSFASNICNVEQLIAHAGQWKVRVLVPDREHSYYADTSNASIYPVDYCLSEQVSEQCELQFSLTILTVVISCNLMEALCMVLMLFKQQSPPLVTLGDAIASFLQYPAKCSEKHQSYERGRRFWFSTMSFCRCYLCSLLCITTILAAAFLLSLALRNDSLEARNLSHLWELGFGKVSQEAWMDWSQHGIILNVLLANFPQALLSFLFLTYNALFTCMLMGQEWSEYAHCRKPLRVTHPRGTQRSTYRLQLPYKYGIPLLLLSAVLHWLVSQSLFLVNIDVLNVDGTEDTTNSKTTIGYSPIAIITVIFMGSLAIVVAALAGFRRYKPGLPVVRSSSLAISAHCHRPAEDVAAAIKPVIWGIPTSGNQDQTNRCCFTSLEVLSPLELDPSTSSNSKSKSGNRSPKASKDIRVDPASSWKKDLVALAVLVLPAGLFA